VPLDGERGAGRTGLPEKVSIAHLLDVLWGGPLWRLGVT
jgi:hypothetical protein